MRTAIIKTERMPADGGFWLMVIKGLHDSGLKVYRDFKNKADVNVVLSGAFENPKGYTGKRVMVLYKNDWKPSILNAWDNMYRDIVKHYYDEILDATDLTVFQTVELVSKYINAQERQTDKS